MDSNIQQRQITVEEYYQMGAHGIIGPEERTQLIEGQILKMSPVGSEHAAIVDTINRLLQVQLGDPAIVRIQNPLHLSEISEPEPDVLVVRSRDDYYRFEHPGPKDVLLLIEVAKESLRFDTTVKMSLYAQAEIPHYVVVNVEHRTLINHRHPNMQSGEYDLVEELHPGQQISFELLETTVPVESLL
jgi:Uma2 family endonuclease